MSQRRFGRGRPIERRAVIAVVKNVASELEGGKSVGIAQVGADVEICKGIGKGHGIFDKAVIDLHLIFEIILDLAGAKT